MLPIRVLTLPKHDGIVAVCTAKKLSVGQGTAAWSKNAPK